MGGETFAETCFLVVERRAAVFTFVSAVAEWVRSLSPGTDEPLIGGLNFGDAPWCKERHSVLHPKPERKGHSRFSAGARSKEKKKNEI